ncbi:hypothetical protein KIN20_032071 [Parelaphostrongylus tenuis]|uniref:Uncharacterized protein n=1 Tax=Parelaphostrongylus tenuis TaxID=148309 RepID=A0AAD5R619_PARTN|nr:hypothetical protein KIN20_032071 [Parelaphostrongylus tenuis]
MKLEILFLTLTFFLLSFTGDIGSAEGNQLDNGQYVNMNADHPESRVKRQAVCGTNTNCNHWRNNGFLQ